MLQQNIMNIYIYIYIHSDVLVDPIIDTEHRHVFDRAMQREGCAELKGKFSTLTVELTQEDLDQLKA